MLTPEEQALLQRHISIDGDGNVVGDYAMTVKQVDGDYSVQVGKQRIWLNLELVKKPPPYLNYIVLHEMVHLRSAGTATASWPSWTSICPSGGCGGMS
jgi:hypothetical protein